LLRAQEEALRLGHDHSDGGHRIVLGLLRGKDDGRLPRCWGLRCHP
jgi:hypothetical protein